MLIIEAFGENGTTPITAKVTRVLVKDEHGNPVCLAVAFDENQILAAHHLDDDFEALLQTFGTYQFTVRNRIDTSEL